MKNYENVGSFMSVPYACKVKCGKWSVVNYLYKHELKHKHVLCKQNKLP